MSFEDKIAIVTGGASGIGRALCQELARKRAKVIVADVNDDGAQQVAADINAAGGQAEVIQLDVANAEAVQAPFAPRRPSLQSCCYRWQSLSR